MEEASGQTVESVWDYPRPPRLERCERHLKIVHAGVVLAETRRALRVLETSHPPVFYLPQQDIAMHRLQPSSRRGSFCEFKGTATYWSFGPGFEESAGPGVQDIAWSYPAPTRAFAELKNHLAFYASRLSLCTVDGERVVPQPGDFYGGWITSHVRGPFKGSPGTMGW